MYADILVPVPVDRPFTYLLPENSGAIPGMRVRVDFAGREVTGCIVRVHHEAPVDFTPKEITSLIDDEPVFGDRFLRLCAFTAENYLSARGEVASMALPSGLRPSSRHRKNSGGNKDPLKPLSASQSAVLKSITEQVEKNSLYHLIFGVTGSGKTEIYIHLASRIISSGRSVIFLVPEISLSSQIFERLEAVFRDELVLYHSGLTAQQRLHSWKRFYSGESKIAVGTRSAVFMQCPDLGLIIIDEEHDQSYKEHSTPRYNARRIAFYRSRKEGAAVVMGSATPSIETFYACQKEVINLHRLESRFGSGGMPSIELVKLSPGNSQSMLTPRLKLYVKKAAEKKQQSILLLNRRGFAPLVICSSCGVPVECPDCGIAMNYHNNGRLICHYCGYTTGMPERCAECGCEELTRFGSGTQRVEESVVSEFSGYAVARLDHDSASRKGYTQDIVAKMKSGEISILLGTQMVAKGFDFPGVSVVGVLVADIGLNMPDYRASERIFSLVTQAAGRCGRGNEPGRVLIQTLDPGNNIFKYIINNDYEGFYKSELEVRRLVGYPPFCRLARLLLRGQNEQAVIDAACSLSGSIRKAVSENGLPVTVLGPSEAPIGRIARNFRHHIILKSKDVNAIRKVIMLTRDSVKGRGLYLEIDIDPSDMM